MARWHPLTKLLVFLGIPILAWLAWTMNAEPQVAGVRRAEGTAAPVEDLSIDPMVVQRRVLPALQTFAAMVERPLFTPSRRLVRPVEPVTEEPEPTVEEPVAEAAPGIERPDLRFFGTVRQRGKVTALVTREGEGSMQQLAVGGDLDGWKVEEVTRDRLVLTQDDHRETYAIFAPGEAPRATPASAPAEAAPEEVSPDEGEQPSDEESADEPYNDAEGQ